MVDCVYVLLGLFTDQFEGVLSIVPVTDVGEAMSEQNLKKDESWHSNIYMTLCDCKSHFIIYI